MHKYSNIFFSDIDECHSNPCINNGTCVDGIASWTCACLHGFIGVHCQIGTHITVTNHVNAE